MSVSPRSWTAEETSTLLKKDLYLSNVGALMHWLKGNIGVGILSLPWAMQYAGIILGPVLMVLIGLMSTHCMTILVKCSRHFSRKLNTPTVGYGETVYYSFLFGPSKRLQAHASKAECLLNTFLFTTSLGVCCVSLLFVAQNVRQVIAVHWDGAPGDRVFEVMLLIPFILLGFIKELKVLAWFSTVANVMVVLSLSMVLRFLLTDIVSQEPRPFSGNVFEISIFVATVTYLFEGVPLVLPIENAMRTPENFVKICCIGMATYISLTIAIGVLGYLKLGSAACGTFTLNLPNADPFYDAIRLLYSIAVCSSYTLQLYIAIDIIWPSIEEKYQPNKIYCELLTRALLVTVTCIAVIAIPDIGNYISLIGASSATAVQFIFPPVLEILTFHSKSGETNYPEMVLIPGDDAESNDHNGHEQDAQDTSGGLSIWRVIKNVLIITFAIIIMVTGTIVAIKNMVENFQNGPASSTCRGDVGPHTSTNLIFVNHTNSPNTKSTAEFGSGQSESYFTSPFYKQSGAI